MMALSLIALWLAWARTALRAQLRPARPIEVDLDRAELERELFDRDARFTRFR
jgi:hypothetical protein